MEVSPTADQFGQLSKANAPKIGQIVQVRSRTYLVDDVVPPPENVMSTLVCPPSMLQQWKEEMESRYLKRRNRIRSDSACKPRVRRASKNIRRDDQLPK